MKQTRRLVGSLDEDQKQILMNLIAFADGFSVDSFGEIPASKLTGLVLKLYQVGWISLDSQDGLYCWTPKFPRREIQRIFSEESTLYRNIMDILGVQLNGRGNNMPALPRQGELGVMQNSDIQKILAKADREEKSHEVAAAIIDYETVINSISMRILNGTELLPGALKRAFTRAVEQRAGLSLFSPNFKKFIPYLFAAQEMAVSIGDQKLQASLELMIGLHQWIALKVKDAMTHLNRAWTMVRNLNDQDLERRSQKLKMLMFVSQGRLFEAISEHERCIGNVESYDDDFTLFTGLGVSLIYTEAGMPQRGLGISEAIRNQCSKQENKPLLSFSFLISGAILLEIRKLKSSKNCFERAAEIAKRENLVNSERLAQIGLICIACLEGRGDIADKIYETIKGTIQSSWYYFLNYHALFETFYRVYGKDVLKGNGGSGDVLSAIKEDNVFPMIANMVHRLQIVLSEGDLSDEEKIAKLTALEANVEQDGATFELAKIRIEIARLYAKIKKWNMAEGYAKNAWQFFKVVAMDAFPGDLLYLLPRDDLSKGSGLSELVVEMGKALATQDNLEGLLTNIIASLSQMTGAERSAIFIKEPESSDVRMVASRNLYYENIQEEEFRSSFDAIQAVFRSGDGNISEFEISDSELFDERKAIIVPLMLKDQMVGVFYQDSRFFSLDTTPEGISILSALASQVALAIDRARAHDEIAKLNKRLIQENLYYLDEKEEFRPFGEVIGSSKGIMDVQRLIRKVAPTQSAVLIQGETGVGKELVARAIHRESSRKKQPFIRVNCAALPESLIDSELFGHEKGAFTGAIKATAGRFELAHQGTIFLDEVSELPLLTQSRLLRILQEKEFQRVGGTKTLHSDFRLIAATNKDLKKEVEAGRFREDLFYRLNVYPILVPPLRERREDIPPLATHFLKLFSAQSNKAYAGITIAEMEKLKAYDWPGNIRELSNIIERAVISDAKPRFAELAGVNEKRETWYGSTDGTLNYKDFEKKLILEALKQCGGVIGGKDGAAELLGMKRTTLIHHMKKLEIKVEHQRSFKDNKKG